MAQFARNHTKMMVYINYRRRWIVKCPILPYAQVGEGLEYLLYLVTEIYSLFFVLVANADYVLDLYQWQVLCLLLCSSAQLATTSFKILVSNI